MNSVLSKLLKRNDLVEQNGKWYYPPYSMNDWIVLTTENAIRFTNSFSIVRGNKILGLGISFPYKLTEYKFIDRRVKDLIKEFNQLTRELKERKVQEKLDNIKKDF